MIIGAPKTSEELQTSKLSTKVTFDNTQRELWYSIPSEHANWFSTDRCDGFVVGLLFQAMEQDEDIVVEGPVSSKLFHNLQNFYVPMMVNAFPHLHQINIKPESLVDEGAAGLGVCTGFSGGIDSFATVIQHYSKETHEGHKITHFLFHNVGSHGHGTPENDRNLFLQRLKTVRPFSGEVALPLIPVDSNLAEIFPIDFIKMHPTLNASIPLVLQNQFQRYFYASTYKYADCGVVKTDDIARFDPLAFHLLSTEGLDCVSTGCQMSRVEKTKMVASYEPSYRYLNVCVDPEFEGRNCSVCFKCCRTILTLELLGMSHFYKNIFDLEKFAKIRRQYVQKVLSYKYGSFEAEIAELYRDKGRGLGSVAFKMRHMLGKLLR